MVIDSSGDQRKLEEERLMRGSKMDEMREREREGAESQLQRGERKNC